jgi:hypothetical protein
MLPIPSPSRWFVDRNGYEQVCVVQGFSVRVPLGSAQVGMGYERLEAPARGALLLADDGPATISRAEVRCRKRLGGLLKSYARRPECRLGPFSGSRRRAGSAAKAPQPRRAP